MPVQVSGISFYGPNRRKEDSYADAWWKLQSERIAQVVPFVKEKRSSRFRMCEVCRTPFNVCLWLCWGVKCWRTLVESQCLEKRTMRKLLAQSLTWSPAHSGTECYVLIKLLFPLIPNVSVNPKAESTLIAYLSFHTLQILLLKNKEDISHLLSIVSVSASKLWTFQWLCGFSKVKQNWILNWLCIKAVPVLYRSQFTVSQSLYGRCPVASDCGWQLRLGVGYNSWQFVSLICFKLLGVQVCFVKWICTDGKIRITHALQRRLTKKGMTWRYIYIYIHLHAELDNTSLQIHTL